MDKQNYPHTKQNNALFERKRLPLLLLPLVFYLVLLLLPIDTATQNPLMVFLGRFHPLMLHFPIVLILLTTAFILLGKFNRNFNKPVIIRSLLGSSVLFTLVAIIAGYLLFISDAYTGALAKNHFYGALITGGGITVSFLFYEWMHAKERPIGFVFFIFLAFTNFALAYTSHMGGSLTHGADYLSEPLASLLPSKIEQKNPEDMLLYDDIVATVLETKCASCHNENKTKGDLLLNSHGALLEAGKSEKKAVVPGKPDASELMVRIKLPEGHEDRMPPEGKPGLTENERAVISFWIANGASQEFRKDEVKDTTILARLEEMMPDIYQAQFKILKDKAEFEAAQKELEAIASKLGVAVSPDKKMNEKFFGMKMKFPPPPFGTEELQEFSPYFPFFSSISLASSNVKDDDLFFLAKMTELRELVLQKTAVTGDGLPYLKDLPHLEVLNLSFTPLEDAHLLHLLAFKSLKKVYLFGTPVKNELIDAFQKHRPEVAVILEEGPN
ncbi:c-type cytochrome domain-containing protein [Cyclobacterium sp.]|uniref:c-type cytochrome domain-containing protein n=1 Tax=Cyclobacterium sp. TaxID=1966343 RepID=UPI00199D27FC|nr:c-type cytochrome domain-containing protein [Cyclobacterium sp.]MBD3628610.1 cytochrome C [Cyclobacterium sp.]